MTRKALSIDRVHRPPIAGICGTKATGAESIVLNDGYGDDQDFGDEIRYTGHGGQDSQTKKQVADQTFEDSGNAALVTSALMKIPVQVVRGFKGDSKYSPISGYRYDGLYRVAEHWQEPGLSGYDMCFFTLLKIDEDETNVFESSGTLPEGNRNPSRRKSTGNEMQRDSDVAEYVKRLFKHACQICGLQLAGRTGPIAHGAHIRGLGSPHNGPDIPSNILCLCPYHHRLFDAGGIYIDDNFQVLDIKGELLGPLILNKEHPIDLEYVRYHREEIARLSSANGEYFSGDR